MDTTTTIKALIRLDASSLSLIGCKRRFQLTNLLGYTAPIQAPWLDFGGAIHQGIADWRRARALQQQHDEKEIIRKAQHWYALRPCEKGEPRDIDNLALVLQQYFDVYRLDNIKPLTVSTPDVAVELPFQIPWMEFEDVAVDLCGAMDLVGECGGRKMFLDVKHSSTTAIQSHQEEQLLRPQFHIYSWVLRKIGFVDYYPPVVVDGVYINKKYRGCKLFRSLPHELSEFMVERVMDDVREWTTEIVRLWRARGKHVAWPCNYSQCAGKYEKCEFTYVCQAPDQFQTLALGQFAQRVYDPRTFGKE